MGIRRGSITTSIIADWLVFNMDAANRACYPKTGTTATDTIGNVTGSLTNGTAFSNDNNGVFDFDGVDDYVNYGNILGMADDGTDSFSVGFWMKRNSTAQEWIVSKQLSSGTYGGFAIFIASGKLNFFLGSGSPSSYIQGKSTDSVTGTTWNNIVVTYDGSQDITGFKIYINGVSNTIVQVSNNTPANVANTTNFQLSSRNGNTSLQYGGKISNTQFYNRELSANEALHNYNALKTRFGLWILALV